MPKTKIFNLRFFNVARGQSLRGSQVQIKIKNEDLRLHFHFGCGGWI